MPSYLSAGSAEQTARISPAKAVTSSRFELGVFGIEIVVHCKLVTTPLPILHTVRNVGPDEPSISVGKVVRNSYATWEHAHLFKSVDVVVVRTYATNGLQDTSSFKLKLIRDDELLRLDSDLQATVVGEALNVDRSLLK